MRIKRHDEERLVITHFPIFLAALGLLPVVLLLYPACGTAVGQVPAGTNQPGWANPLFALLFSLFWLGTFSWLVRRLTFDFDLVRRELRWNQWSVFGTKSGVMPFAEIRRATIESGKSKGSLTYRPVLLTRHGTFPLLNYSTSGFFAKRRFEHIVTAIERCAGTCRNKRPGM